MKNLTNFLGMLLAAGVLAITPGCTTTNQTERLLSRAGFKAIPAATLEQEKQLHQLPEHQVSTVMRNGVEHFVYPDPDHNLLYVGQRAQYQQYRKLRKYWEEDANPAAMPDNGSVVWASW